MLNQIIARLHKFVGRAKGDHGLHAPFRVTTHHGHTVRAGILRTSPRRITEKPAYFGWSLRASITVKASGAPPRVDGMWLPAWRVSSLKTRRICSSDWTTPAASNFANLAEYVAALSIERGDSERLRIGLSVRASDPQFFRGPHAEELVEPNCLLPIIGAGHRNFSGCQKAAPGWRGSGRKLHAQLACFARGGSLDVRRRALD